MEIECPYCNFKFDDDEWGEQDEGIPYEKECSNCEETMILSFSMFPFFTAKKTEGKNGR